MKRFCAQVFVSVIVFLSGALTAVALPQVVVLKTGETVLGEVLPASNDKTLRLKSDLLGNLSISRDSIVSIEAQNTSKNLQLFGAGPAVAKGGSVKGGAVPAAKSRKKKREGFLGGLSDIEAPKAWRGNLRFGLNASTGDRKWNETNIRGNLRIQEEGSPHFFRFNGSYTYRINERNNGTEFRSADRYDGTFTYRHSFTEGWFVQNAAGIRSDRLKGINRELQDVVGLGFKIKPSPKFEFVLGGGGGVEYIDAEFQESHTTDAVVNVFQEFTYRPTKRTSFVQEFNYFVNPQDSNSFNFIFKAAIRVRLTNLLGLEFSFNKDFDNEVRDGDVEDDTQFRNALVVYF